MKKARLSHCTRTPVGDNDAGAFGTGAASFVVFSGLVPGEGSPTRVAAQVVSGIGFLGAGLIFREGLSVRGLNTAATLWCSAAVGVLAGGGYLAYAKQRDLLYS
jgi:uncharacterized membrane protein YhiD involved in acid resistance